MGIRGHFWEPLALGPGGQASQFTPGAPPIPDARNRLPREVPGKPFPRHTHTHPTPGSQLPPCRLPEWGGAREGGRQELGRRREIWSLGCATFRSEREMEFLAVACERGSGFPFHGGEKSTERAQRCLVYSERGRGRGTTAPRGKERIGLQEWERVL